MCRRYGVQVEEGYFRFECGWVEGFCEDVGTVDCGVYMAGFDNVSGYLLFKIVVFNINVL